MESIVNTTSQAREMTKHLLSKDPSASHRLMGIAAPSSVSHERYAVGYFSDKSILIWAHGEGYIVLDGDRTYYRDTVEHLARCLSMFSKERRAEMLKGESQWIDGIHWDANGDWIGIS